MSALDARMRIIAEQALVDFTAAAEATQKRLTAVEEEVADLRAKLEGSASTPAPKRATRAKTTETTE